MDVNTLVCSFITRGKAGDPGQGTELLFYTPVTQRGGTEASPESFEYVLLEGLKDAPVGKPDSAFVASSRAIAKHCFLDDKKDLVLVRRSRRFQWGTAFIESFVWRTTKSYEQGLEHELEQELARSEGRQPTFPPGMDPETYDKDLATFRLVEQKLGGPQYHSWPSFAFFDKHPEELAVEFVSTAFFLGILPPMLDRAIPILSSVKAVTSASDATELAMKVLFEVVSTRVGRKAFRCWAPGIPPPTQQTKQLPEGVLKYRLWVYLLEVVAHYVRTANPQLETNLSSTFLRVLQPLRSSLLDSGVSVESFERGIVASISTELKRSRLALGVLEKLAIGKILERPATKGVALPKRPFLHIFTLGNSATVFGALRELIHYLLTVSAHPYSTLNPAINPLTRQQEFEWLNRPEHLKISIAETRPTGAGVHLAARLLDVLDNSSGRAKQLRDLSRPFSAADGGVEESLQERLKKLGASDEGGGVYGSLESLLRASGDGNGVPVGASKVSLEVIPDGAITLALRNAPPGQVVVLIGAERICPGDSDVVAPLGAFVMAWCAKELKGKVYALAATESIESSHKPSKPDLPPGDVALLTDGWKILPNSGTLAPLAQQVADKKNERVRIISQTSEIVSHKCIDAYVTENGVLSKLGCAALGRERGDAEQALYGK